jgi:hypothetical protein
MSDKSNAMRFVGDSGKRAFAEVARESGIEFALLHRRAVHADDRIASST